MLKAGMDSLQFLDGKQPGNILTVGIMLLSASMTLRKDQVRERRRLKMRKEGSLPV